MAKTLWEALQQQRRQLSGTGGFTGQAQQIQQAQTGQIPTGPQVRPTALQEQATTLAGEQQAQALGQQQQYQQAQQSLTEADQAQQLAFQRQQSQQQRAALKQTLQDEMDRVYTGLARERGAMATEEQLSNLEHYGFLQALQDDQYLAGLQNEGQLRRLDNAQQFDDALQAAVFRDQVNMLESEIGFKRILAADDRQFNEFLASINAPAALEYALNQTKNQIQIKNLENMQQSVTAYAPKAFEAMQQYGPEGVEYLTQAATRTTPSSAGYGPGGI